MLLYIDSVNTILFGRYCLSGAENGQVTLFPWGVILIRILSKAVIILLFVSPEVTKGLY